jgi:REP element-mobilizing transposase RayT
MCLFGKIHEKKLKLNDAGKMIANIFINLPQYYESIMIDTYIVMPDHFHGIIAIVSPVGASLCGRPKLNVYKDHAFKYRFMTKNNFKFHHFNSKPLSCSQKGRAQRPAPTGDDFYLGEIVGRFKSYTTTQYSNSVKIHHWPPFYEKLWQRGYYDRIIRNERELYAIRKYIINNPLNWKSTR